MMDLTGQLTSPDKIRHRTANERDEVQAIVRNYLRRANEHADTLSIWLSASSIPQAGATQEFEYDVQCCFHPPFPDS